MAQQSGWCLAVTRSDHTGPNTGGFRGNFHHVSLKLPSWQSLAPGATAEVAMTYQLPISGPSNFTVTFGGKSYGVVQDYGRGGTGPSPTPTPPAATPPPRPRRRRAATRRRRHRPPPRRPPAGPAPPRPGAPPRSTPRTTWCRSPVTTGRPSGGPRTSGRAPPASGASGSTSALADRLTHPTKRNAAGPKRNAPSPRGRARSAGPRPPAVRFRPPRAESNRSTAVTGRPR